MTSVADVVELDEERVKRGSVKDDSFESAGAMLRAARESRKLSVEDVSEATNIREVHIEAIEAMEIAKLPVAAYTTGFVKAYAQLLELPVEALVSRFREEAGYAKSSIAPQVNMPTRRELAGGKELSLLAVVAILAFIIWVAWQVLREPESDGPVQIAGTPLQERPIDARTASNGGANEVPVARPEPNTNVEPIPGMPTNETQAPTGLDATGVDLTDNTAESSGETAITTTDGGAPVLEVASEASAGDALSGDAPDNATSTATNEDESDAASLDAAEVTPSAADELNAQQIASVDETETSEAAAETVAPGETDDTPAVDAQPEASDIGLASATDVLDETAPQAIVGQAAPGTLDDTSQQTDDAAAVDVVYTEPVSTGRVSPIYPRRCERLSTGTEAVVVTYDISSRGAPVNVRVTETTNECFNAAAISAVSRWSFDPATRNGSPIPVYTRSTRFRFELPQ